MRVDRQKLKAWIQASRPPFFIATFIPLTIGWILGAQHGTWHPWRFVLVVWAAMMVHMATNLANDYFDHLQGTDAGESIGGSRVIQEGKLTLQSLRKALILLYALALLVGLYFMVALDLWGLCPLVFVALFSSFFYVAPPIRYGYYGFGEFSVAINMGPIMVIGTYWVIRGRPDWEPFYVSLPVGLMVASILYYQSLPDIHTDASAGKNTLAVRLGKRRACQGLILQWIIVYLSILALLFAGILSPLAFATLVTVPIFIRMVGVVKKTVNWVDLDRYGKYVRILYFLNGLIIIISLYP